MERKELYTNLYACFWTCNFVAAWLLFLSAFLVSGDLNSLFMYIFVDTNWISKPWILFVNKVRYNTKPRLNNNFKPKFVSAKTNVSSQRFLKMRRKLLILSMWPSLKSDISLGINYMLKYYLWFSMEQYYPIILFSVKSILV